MWRYRVVVTARNHITTHQHKANTMLKHEKSKLKRFTAPTSYVCTTHLSHHIHFVIRSIDRHPKTAHRLPFSTRHIMQLRFLTSRCLSPPLLLASVGWCWKSFWFSLVLNIFWWARLNSSMRILWIAGDVVDIFFLLASVIVIVGPSFLISELASPPLFVSPDTVSFFSARFRSSSLIASLKLDCSTLDGFALPKFCSFEAAAIEAASIFVTECRFCSIIITLLSLFFIKWFVAASFSCFACDSCVLELLISSYTVLLIVLRLGTSVLLIIVGPSSDNFMTVVLEFFLPATLLSDCIGIFGISAGTARSCRHSTPLLPLLLKFKPLSRSPELVDSSRTTLSRFDDSPQQGLWSPVMLLALEL